MGACLCSLFVIHKARASLLSLPASNQVQSGREGKIKDDGGYQSKQGKESI